MKANEIRQCYINYFKSKNHNEISGASLIPENDPSVLFTTAGMHPLVPYLLGEPHPSGKRLVNYQKCLRTGDIDEVGDDIHLTFFEMLGNWSLGDYFKSESIEMSYNFLIERLKLDHNRIYVTVFAGDNDCPKDIEAYQTWRDLGIEDEKIFFYSKKENWWGPAGQTGPCGPDSEIFYDSLKERCSPNCEPKCNCGKYWEIWNNVFMQYNKEPNGKFTPLLNKNVDTGFGLERVTAIMQNKESIYDTELFFNIYQKIKSESKTDNLKSIRIISDHIRASCFLLSDRVTPSNVDQGYILRRLIRRVIRHMKKLFMDPDIISTLGKTTINSLKEIYPELIDNRSFILSQLDIEKTKFMRTLQKGEKKFFAILNSLKENNKNNIDGKSVFQLYDTYGFPPELVKELADENGFTADIDQFEKLYKEHQISSREGAKDKFKGGLIDNSEETTALHTATHILHQALRIVLGDHIKQKGSNITSKRLRFDFSHPKKMSKDEIEKTEKIVNEVIQKQFDVTWVKMSIEEAKNTNVIGLFENKYGENVKVYSINDFSKEICGGPHVNNTGELGLFKIIKEQSSSAGVRRIKAVLEK